jgi:hypothetical protein
MKMTSRQAIKQTAKNYSLNRTLVEPAQLNNLLSIVQTCCQILENAAAPAAKKVNKKISRNTATVNIVLKI